MGVMGERTNDGVVPWNFSFLMLCDINSLYRKICADIEVYVNRRPYIWLADLSFVVIPVSAISPKLTGCLVTIEKDHTLWVAFLSLAIFETSEWMGFPHHSMANSLDKVILVLTLGTRLRRRKLDSSSMIIGLISYVSQISVNQPLSLLAKMIYQDGRMSFIAHSHRVWLITLSRNCIFLVSFWYTARSLSVLPPIDSISPATSTTNVVLFLDAPVSG